MARSRRVLVALAVVLGCAIFVNPYLRGDGNGYYAYVRSVVIDHDLKFQNEFAHGDPAFVRATTPDGKHFTDAEQKARPGYIRNPWSVGASLFWTPFFVAAHVFAKATGHWPADGFSFPYRWACAFGTALYAAIGIYLARRVAARVTNEKAATIGTVAVLGASMLPVYMFFLPFWGLALATLPASVLVYTWSKGPSWSVQRWLLYGAMVGLAATTHPLGICWIALLGFAWFYDKPTIRQRVIAGAASAGGFLLAEVPQMIVRAIVHGSPFDLGYESTWQFTKPQIWGELFSAKHGLFTWTPVLIFAVVGLVQLARKPSQRRLGLGLLVTFLALLYLSGAYVTDELSSFGNRMFLHFTPGFVVGAAAFAASIKLSKRKVLVSGVAALIVWNGLFAFQWAWGLIPKREAVDWGQMIRQQFTTAPKEIGRAAVRFFTDRDGLIHDVQQRDEDNLSSGSD